MVLLHVSNPRLCGAEKGITFPTEIVIRALRVVLLSHVETPEVEIAVIARPV